MLGSSGCTGFRLVLESRRCRRFMWGIRRWNVIENWGFGWSSWGGQPEGYSSSITGVGASGKRAWGFQSRAYDSLLLLMTLTNSRLFIFLTWCHGPSFLSCHFGSQAHCLILSTRQSCFRRVWIFLIVWQEKIIRNNLNSFPLPKKSSVITFIIFLHAIDLLEEQNPVSCPFKIFHILDCPSASLFVVVVNFPSIPSVLCGLLVKDKALIGFRVTPYDPPRMIGAESFILC